MKKLARHSLYLSLFLGTLLTIAGLSLYPELPTLVILGTVLIIMAGIFLLAWLFFRINSPTRPPIPPQPRTTHERLEVN